MNSKESSKTIKVITAGNCMMCGKPINIDTRKNSNKMPNIFFCQKCEKRRNNMARPKKENKKDIQYRVRLDAETAAELESLHKKSGMCKAWIIRELIHTAYKTNFYKRERS